jgi:hypothetical protein
MYNIYRILIQLFIQHLYILPTIPIHIEMSPAHDIVLIIGDVKTQMNA